MPFQLRELAIPVVSHAMYGAPPELGSTCRKGGSTCVARGDIPLAAARGVPRPAELELVRQQIRHSSPA